MSVITTNIINKKSNVLAFAMWALTLLFYVWVSLQSMAPGVMTGELMSGLKLTPSYIELLAWVFTFSYAFMLVPAGLLLDWLNVRYLLALALSSCVIGGILFLQPHSLDIYMLANGLIGFGVAVVSLARFKVISNWFSANKFAVFASLSVSIGMLCMMFGNVVVAEMITGLGWRTGMLVLASVSGVFALSALLLLRNQPTHFAKQENAHKVKKEKSTDVFGTLVQFIILAVFGGLIVAAFFSFSTLWGVPFLHATYSVDFAAASDVISVAFLGFILGCPLIAWASEKIKRRRPLMYVASLGALIAISAVIYLPAKSTLLLGVLLFCFGFFSGGYLVSLYMTREIFPHRNGGTVFGFMLLIYFAITYYAKPVVGLMLDYVWSGQLQNGMPVYSAEEYKIAMSLLPIMVGLATLLIPLLRETHCEPVDTREDTFKART